MKSIMDEMMMMMMMTDEMTWKQEENVSKLNFKVYNFKGPPCLSWVSLIK